MRKQKKRKERSFHADREYADALDSMKKIIMRQGNSVFKEPKQNDEMERMQIEERLMKVKVKKISNLFIDKLKRKSQYGQPIRRFFISGVDGFHFHFRRKGIKFPQKLYNFIVIANLLSQILILFLSTFLAFLPHFTQNYAQNLSTRLIIVVSLCSFIGHFFMKLTNQSYIAGKKKIFIGKIVRAYAEQKRLFFDLALILLLCVVIAIPTQTIVSAVLFFFDLLCLIIYSDDLIIVEVSHIATQKQRLVIQMLKIFFFNIIFAHVMGTILLAMAQLDPEDNWIILAGQSQSNWWDIYVQSFYWATTIMMTVGFGDFLPANTRQMIITSFVQIISCIILSYNISAIGEILGRMRKSEENVRVKMAIFEKMIRKGKNKFRKNNRNLLRGHNFRKDMFETATYIDAGLEQSIYNYIKDLNISNQGFQESERNRFLQQLPDHLRKSFFQQANRVIFPTVTFFNNLKPKTLQKMAENFSSKLLHPGQYVGQEETANIVILEYGKIGLAYNRKGSTINGEIMQKIVVSEEDTNTLITNAFLYLSKPQKYNIVALSYSLAWKIDMTIMFQILSTSKMDYQYYFNVLHKHTMDINQWEVIQCDICHKFHTVFDCYRLTYLPMRELVVGKQIMKKSMESDRFFIKRKRSSLPKISSLKFRKNFYKVVERFTINAYKKDILDQQIKNRGKAHLMQSRLREQQRGRMEIQEQNYFLLNTDQHEQKLKKIMLEVIREYDTGYEQGFWDLQVDMGKNYEFYFPQNNCNKFVMTAMRKINTKLKTKKKKKLLKDLGQGKFLHLL